MNRLKQVDLIYMKRSRYKLNVTIGIIIVLLVLAFGCSFGVYYKQYQQLLRIYTELYTKHTSLSKGFVCENAEPYPTYKIITKIPKQIVSQSTVQQLNATSPNTASNRYPQRLQAEEQEFEYFTKILQIKPILKDLVLENLLADTNTSDDTGDSAQSNDSNYYQEMFKKYGQMTSIEQIDSSKIEPEEIDNVLMITSAGSLEYTNFTNYHIQEEQLLENLDAVGLKPNSKIDIPKDVQLTHQKGCGIPYSPTPQSILIDNDVYLPIRIRGNVKTDDKLNAIQYSNYKGDIVVEGIAGNITVQKGVAGNIAVQQGGVGGRIHITGNVGENITATDQSQDDTTTIYIEGNVIGHKNGTIQVKGQLSSEEGNVIEVGSIYAITNNDTQRANAFVVHSTIEVSDNGIAILNNESKDNAFVFGQRMALMKSATDYNCSSLSNCATEKNGAYKYIDYKPRGFFVNGSLIGCNNNSQFNSLAIHVRGDLKAPYGAVFNKSFEGASTNGATALSIGGELKGYWNSLSTKSILLVEEETGVEECLQNEECLQELYLQRIYRVCANIEKQYNLSITEEECANLHHINTGVVEVLGGIKTVAGNGISVSGDIDCKGSNGKGITVSGEVIGNTYGISVGDVSVTNGEGITVKSITSAKHALQVNGDIISNKSGLGILVNGSIKAKQYTLTRTIRNQTQKVEPNKNNNPLMYNPIGAVFINGTITQEQPTNIKYTYNWNYNNNKYNSISTIITDSTIHSIVVNNTQQDADVLNGGIFISKGTIKTTSPDTAFTADKIISSGKHAIDVQYASIDGFNETNAVSGQNSDKVSVVQIGKVETINSNATGIRVGSVNTPSGRGIWIYKTSAQNETGEIISGESNIHIEDGIESHGSEAIKIGGDVINHGSKGIIINGKVQAQSNRVLYVKDGVEQIVKEESTVIQIDGDVQAISSSQPDNKIIYIGGDVGTAQPTHSVYGAGIGVYIGGNVKCRNSGIIIEGGIEANGFRGDQPENDPNYGFKAKYIDVSYKSTGEVAQGPYGIHVGWIKSYNTSINITNEDHTQTINTTDEDGVEKEETITIPAAIQTNYTAISIGGDIEGYGRHIELTEQQKNDLSQYTYNSSEYNQTFNNIKQSFEYNLVSIDGDIKADITTFNEIEYNITYQNDSTANIKNRINHAPKLLLSTKGLYSSMEHSLTDGIQINGHIEAANGITVVGNITTSLTSSGGGLYFNNSFVNINAYVKIKGSLYQIDTSKSGPNGIVVGGVIRAKNSNGFYIANSNKAVDKANTIEAGHCISVNYGNLVASTSSISQHVIQIWSGDIIVEESVPLGSPSEGEEPEIKTHTIPAGTYTTQQIIDKLIDFTAPIGININGNIQNLKNGLGFRLVGDIIAQTNGVYISGTVKTDYQDAKSDKGVSYSAIYAGKIESNWNGITVGNIEAEKIGIAVKGTVKQTGTHERCYYDCLEVDTGNNPSPLNISYCKQCREETNYKNIIDDVPAAISVQSIQSTGIGYGIHVFEYIKTKNDSIKVSGLNQPICDNSEKLNTSICSNNANGIIINGTIYAGKTGIDLNGDIIGHESGVNITGNVKK